ncbi:hypothetical protein [Caudoviricetes sp.]|nr:hypothetical protein [Caudoviricetes sp.]
MSLPWIKIATDITTDAKVHAVAKACRVTDAEAVGLVVSTLVSLPNLAPNGDVSDVQDATLERVALWEGKRGVFAAAFRAVWCTDGVVTNWLKWNGAVVREAEKRAPRAKEWREKNAARMHSERIQNEDLSRLESGKMEKEIETTTGSYKQGEEYSPSAPADALAVVSPEAHAALSELFRHVPDAAIWTGLLRGYASGSLMDSNRPCEASRLGVAVVDFVAAGKHLAPGGPNPALFRGFVKKARAPERQYANQQTEAEFYADQLASIRRKNQRRALTGQPLMEEPKWAGQIDQMFPDGRTHPTGQAA